MSAQNIDDLRFLSTQPTDRVENRQIRFASPVLFQTLTSNHQNAPISSDALGERVHQSGLADASFTHNKYDLPFYFEHLLQPASHPRQGFLTSNDSLRGICLELR